MNYIAEIKAFYDLVMTNQLSTGQIALWHALMHINNKCAWQEWFSVPNLTLELHTGMSRQGIQKARNTLKQKGVIDFRTNGTKATLYQLQSLSNGFVSEEKKATTTPNSFQDGCQDSFQMSFQDGCQDGFQDGSTLNKPNHTKPNKKEIDQHFESIWLLYPTKKGKGQVSDTQKRKLYAIGLEELSRCIERYKASKPDWQDFQHGSTFFNSGYVDYLDENYSASSADTPRNGDRSDDGRVFLNGKWVQI